MLGPQFPLCFSVSSSPARSPAADLKSLFPDGCSSSSSNHPKLNTLTSISHYHPAPQRKFSLAGHWKNLNEDKLFSSSCSPFATIKPLKAGWHHCTPIWSPGHLDNRTKAWSGRSSQTLWFQVQQVLQADNHFQIYPALSDYGNTKEVKEEKQEATWFNFPERFQVSQINRETIFPQDKNDAKICVTKPKKPFGILFVRS